MKKNRINQKALSKAIRYMNITQGDLAETLGIHESTLSRKINGSIPFKRDEIRSIADQLVLFTDDIMNIFLRDYIESLPEAEVEFVEDLLYHSINLNLNAHRFSNSTDFALEKIRILLEDDREDPVTLVSQLRSLTINFNNDLEVLKESIDHLENILSRYLEENKES